MLTGRTQDNCPAARALGGDGLGWGRRKPKGEARAPSPPPPHRQEGTRERSQWSLSPQPGALLGRLNIANYSGKVRVGPALCPPTAQLWASAAGLAHPSPCGHGCHPASWY